MKVSKTFWNCASSGVGEQTATAIYLLVPHKPSYNLSFYLAAKETSAKDNQVSISNSKLEPVVERARCRSH